MALAHLDRDVGCQESSRYNPLDKQIPVVTSQTSIPVSTEHFPHFHLITYTSDSSPGTWTVMVC